VHEFDHSKDGLNSPFIPESRFGTYGRPNAPSLLEKRALVTKVISGVMRSE
jgi:hypothetical protein